MFANLKKKIEEEVGDLGRLASPINLSGALGDRRVGGSTQGTNTPSNLGSRQSSIASLIDITESKPNVQTRVHPSNSSQNLRDLNNEETQQLKKINADLKLKLDNLKKSYEEKLQNQEADFAWKYNSKEDELTQLRNERDRFKDQLKAVEGNWQEKYVRVATELDNLEGLSKQENAKVKHLLLNTQNELQISLRRIAELESESKNRRDRENANLLLATETHNSALQGQANPPLEELSAEKSKLEKLNCEQLEKISELEKKNSKLQTLLDESSKVTTESSNKYSNLSELHDKTKEDFAAVQNELAQLKDKYVELQQQHTNQQNLDGRRQTEIKDSQASFDNLKTIYEAAVKELNNAKSEITNLNSAKTENDTQLKGLEMEIADLKNQLDQKSIAAGDKRNSLESEPNLIMLDNHDSLLERSDLVDKSEIDKLNRNIESLNQLLTDAEKVKENLSKENQELKSVLAQLREEHHQEVITLQSTVTQEQQAKEQAAKAERRIKELESELQQVVGENEVLQQDKQELEMVVTERDELVKLRNEVLNFKNEYAAFIDVANGELENVKGNSADEIKLFKRIVLDKLKVYTKLDEEMRVIKDEANKEVHNLQCKTDELVSAAIRDLKETQTKLEEEKQRSKQLLVELGEAQNETRVLQQNLDKSRQECNAKQEELESLGGNFSKANKKVHDLTKVVEDQTSSLKKTQDTIKKERDQLSNIKSQLDAANTRIIELEADVTRSRDELLTQQSQHSQQESAETASMKKQLLDQRQTYENKLEAMRKESQEIGNELKAVKIQRNQFQQERQELLTKLDLTNTRHIQNEEEVRILTEKSNELSNEVEHWKIVAENSELDKVALSVKVEEGNLLLTKQIAEDELRIQGLELKIDSMQEQLMKQEMRTSEGADEYLKLQRTIDGLQAQLSDSKNFIIKLQDEKDSFSNQLDEMSVLKSLAEEEVKTVMDRSSDLYNEVTELKKSLRTSRQQVSELKKSFTKELKNDVGAVNSANSGSVVASSNVAGMEEVSLRDQSHHGDVNPPYSDVNFMYLRSVLFKYLTASDPQVAANLTRVVSTLLELKPDEEKLLRETQENHRHWYNSLLKK